MTQSGHSLLQANFSLNNPDSLAAISPCAGRPQAMLTLIYIEALLVDEELADQVWAAWDSGAISDESAGIAWMMISSLANEHIGALLNPHSSRNRRIHISIDLASRCTWRDTNSES